MLWIRCKRVIKQGKKWVGRKGKGIALASMIGVTSSVVCWAYVTDPLGTITYPEPNSHYQQPIAPFVPPPHGLDNPYGYGSDWRNWIPSIMQPEPNMKDHDHKKHHDHDKTNIPEPNPLCIFIGGILLIITSVLFRKRH